MSSGGGAPGARRAKHGPGDLSTRAFTSREAARASGVPFFTVDYWDRTRFIQPTVAKGKGRGKGRQRMYSYGDLIRLSIARELRNQRVSLETLRSIVKKLAPHADDLVTARYVLVGRDVETARNTAELLAILRQPDRQTFGVVLDLRTLVERVHERVAALGPAPQP